MEIFVVILALVVAIISGIQSNWVAMIMSISGGLWALNTRSWRKRYEDECQKQFRSKS